MCTKWCFYVLIILSFDLCICSMVISPVLFWRRHFPYGCGSKCKVWIKPRSHTRSRPPIQTFRKDLIQTFDPDLWNDIMYWWVDVWSSDGCMLLGFLLCSYSPAKQQTVVKPRCQAVKLPSCTCRKVTLLSSQAVQQPSCNCCTSKLSNCQADTVASCKASLPSSQAAHLLPAHLVVLFLSCCIQAATYTNMWVHFWGRSRPGSRPIQTRSRPQPQPAPTQTTSSYVLKLVIVWFLSLLQTLGSQSINFGTHVNGTKSANSWIRSVNTIARPLRLSGQATDSCRHLMSYHENMIFYLGPWKTFGSCPFT